MAIELTTPEELRAATAATEATGFVSNGLMQRLLNCREDADQTRGQLLGRAMQLEEDSKEFIRRSTVDRVTQLEAELGEVCELGRIAEQELAAASAGVMAARVGDANRENAHNMATMKLKLAQEAPLKRFYGPQDEAEKAAAIARAKSELDAAIVDMQLHPLAIPTAVNAEQEAKRKVSALAAKEAALRHKIANLTGQQAQPTGSPDNGTGLR